MTTTEQHAATAPALITSRDAFGSYRERLARDQCATLIRDTMKQYRYHATVGGWLSDAGEWSDTEPGRRAQDTYLALSLALSLTVLGEIRNPCK